MAAAPGVRRSELGDALRACRNAFIGVGIMSCMINLLYLTGSIFMLEVYDRVLPSRSVPTLVGLVVLCGFLYIAQGVLDLMRGRMLGRIGTSLDEALNERVFDTVVRLPLIVGTRNEGLQPLRDLDNVRSFLGSMGPGAFFDLPWLPLYLAICFALPLADRRHRAGRRRHPGRADPGHRVHVAPAGARTRWGWPPGATISRRRSRRNAEVLVAMGMTGRLTKRWSETNEEYIAGNQRASDVAGGLGAVAKVLRMMLQSAVLAVGAYLVIHQEATAGIIIAGSILSARALAPVDLAIAHWKGFVAARQSWHRLNNLLEQLPAQQAQTAAAAAGKAALGRGRDHRAARRAARHRAGRHLRARSRQRARRHRAERLGQVVAGARAGRRLAAGARQGAARRRGARPMVVRRARPPRRLSAAGRRAVRRHHRAEHLPLRSRGRNPKRSSPRPRKPACTR